MPSEVFADNLLAGRGILVTGGGTGLGRASAEELIRCGARVVICGRREDVLEATASDIGCAWIGGDIRTAEGAAALIDAAVAAVGRLDVLVNNAGGQYFVPAEQINARGWRAVWRLNVGGTDHMTQAAVERAFRPQGGGMVINTTLSPHHGLAGMVHSSAARAAVEGATKALAKQLAADGVGVVALAAGHFETKAIQKYPESVQRSVRGSVPLQRMGTEAEHAWLVTMCASPLGQHLSGSVITLDGARDNWYGPWPPADILADDTGDVPTEIRRDRPVTG